MFYFLINSHTNRLTLNLVMKKQICYSRKLLNLYALSSDYFILFILFYLRTIGRFFTV